MRHPLCILGFHKWKSRDKWDVFCGQYECGRCDYDVRMETHYEQADSLGNTIAMVGLLIIFLVSAVIGIIGVAIELIEILRCYIKF
jgi:hypothetical protein